MSEHIAFDEFCNHFGFKAYPFNSFTAEDETARQPHLFVETKLYSLLSQAFEAGQTIILSGDRGTGKTSITYDFIRRADQKTLICQIDDFMDLTVKYSESQFYKFILKCLVNRFFSDVHNLKRARTLSEEQKILLTYYYINFATAKTKGVASRVVQQIHVHPLAIWTIKLYNFFRAFLNIATNVGVAILTDVISRSAGAGHVRERVSEYFPEIKLGIEDKIPKPEYTLEALRKFSELCEAVGYSRITLILDKVDEDPRLENAAEEIADFVLPILNNNKFLLDVRFQVIVSLWIVPLNFIKDQVRTQKIHSEEIRWENTDLKRAYEKRISVFSDREALSFDQTFDTEVSQGLRDQLLELSNRNPRDLWHLMNCVFRAQYDVDARSKRITTEAVKKGMADFVKGFNFYEYYPRKSNARANSMDVYSYIRHLLRLEGATFTRNQLNDRAGTGSSTLNYTVGMESLGLIEKDMSEKGEAKYRIRDPKVRFAIAQGIEITK